MEIDGRIGPLMQSSGAKIVILLFKIFTTITSSPQYLTLQFILYKTEQMQWNQVLAKADVLPH
jgi:hypothetical protein